MITSRKAPGFVSLVDDKGNIVSVSEGRLKVEVDVESLTASNMSISSVDGAGMEAAGKYMPVKLTGSIVELAKLNTDTVITAGSSLTILNRTTERLNYKEIRATVRFSANTDFAMELRFWIAAGSGTQAGDTISVAKTSSSIGSFKGDVYGSVYDFVVKNSSASDATLRFCQVLGVR